MPSIDTVINDLATSAIVGFGAKPPSNEENAKSILSDTHRMKYSSVHMKAEISPSNRLSCPSAVGSTDFNGNYLHYAVDWATIAKLDTNRPLVVSGNFSGCAYKVYNTNSTDGIVCIHISRPAGPDSDAVVNLVEDYAGQKNWTQLHAIGTLGHIGNNGCTEVILVSQLSGSTVESILLEIDNTGLLVGTSDRTATNF